MGRLGRLALCDKMVEGLGIAPSTTGLQPAMILIHQPSVNWHAASGSHRAVRFWRPDRPLGHLRRMKLGAGGGSEPPIPLSGIMGPASLPLLHPAMESGREVGCRPLVSRLSAACSTVELHHDGRGGWIFTTVDF